MVAIGKNDIVYHEKWGRGKVHELKNTSDPDNIMASVIFDNAPMTNKNQRLKRAIHISHLDKSPISTGTDVYRTSEEEGLKARINELVNKNMIPKEQVECLKNMVDSDDKENMEVAKTIVNIKIEDVLQEGLNKDQTKAFLDIVEFFHSGVEDALVLKGYAGTGKTFLISRVIEYITATEPRKEIAIAAPTNKAVKVAMESSPFLYNREHGNLKNLNGAQHKTYYATVHRLLNLKEKIDDNGNQTFEPEKKKNQKFNKEGLRRNTGYIIVDEVSMLNDLLCEEILNLNDKAKIIFIGDPAQIPPVGRTECIPFIHPDKHDYDFKVCELKEIMRQKDGNPIVDYSFRIRNNLGMDKPVNVVTKYDDKGHGVITLDYKTEKQKVRPLLKKYFDNDEFEADADYMKVIAWRNVTVDYINSVVRELLYGKDAPKYVEGEKIIANKSIFSLSDNRYMGWEIQFYTSDEMEIVSIQPGTKKFKEGHYSLNANIKKIRVRSYDPKEKAYKRDIITVFDDDSLEELEKLLKRVKSDAIRHRDAALWVNYYNIMKWSADIGYNYAITAHKSQGSTYKNVLIMENDLDYNSRIVERNRIKYTAYTRASEKLFILK